MAQTAKSTQDELARRHGAAARLVFTTFLFTLLLVAAAFTGFFSGSLSYNQTLVGTLAITIVFLGVGAVVFRRTRFSAMRLQDIAALRGASGLLETLQWTTVYVTLIGGFIALLGFCIYMMTGVWSEMLWFGGIAGIVLLYAYPRRAAWASVVRALADDAGEAGDAAKGTIS